MSEKDLGFPRFNENGADINSLEAIKEKLNDKCGILDRALLQQFQTDYTKPKSNNLATFEIWGSSIIERLRTNFIMAYSGDEDTMIIPEGGNQSEYNVCAHEMTHTLWDTAGERQGLLLLPDYSGPSIEEIEKYSSERVENSDFDIVRSQQEVHILNASLEHLINTLPGILNNFRSERDKANGRLRSIKDELDEPGQVAVRPEQQAQLDQSFAKRTELWDLWKENSSNIANYWIDSIIPILEELDAILQSSREDKSVLVSESFYEAKKRLDSAMHQLNILLQELSDTHLAYVNEATRGHQEIKSIVEENHQAWLGDMQAILDNSDIDEEKRIEVQGQIDIVKKIREMGEITNMLSSVMDDSGQLTSRVTQSVNQLKEKSILDDATSGARDIIGDPEEVFARMIDSLYSVYLGDVDQNNFPLNESDLDFLSKMNYKGEQIFRKGIEKYRVALQMQEDGVPIDEIRERLIPAESFEYRGISYNWSKYPFEIQGDLPYIASIKDFN